MTQERFAADGTRLTVSRYELIDGQLTPRQRQIVSLYVGGMTRSEIAERLDLSVYTINPSLKQSARRMGITGISREELAQRAAETDNLDDSLVASLPRKIS